MSHHDDHDDFGDPHRDPRATGAVIDRRRALRMAAKFGAGLGAGLGALQLLGSSTGADKSAGDRVYATPGYEQSVRNLGQISLATDTVFSDGAALELATVTGSIASGMTAALAVAVSGA